MQSQLIGYSDTETHVELRMLNQNKNQLKAVMWGKYVHVDLAQQKRTAHSQELMALFEQAMHSVNETNFEQRAAFLKQAYAIKNTQQ